MKSSASPMPPAVFYDLSSLFRDGDIRVTTEWNRGGKKAETDEGRRSERAKVKKLPELPEKCFWDFLTENETTQLTFRSLNAFVSSQDKDILILIVLDWEFRLPAGR